MQQKTLLSFVITEGVVKVQKGHIKWYNCLWQCNSNDYRRNSSLSQKKKKCIKNWIGNMGMKLEIQTGLSTGLRLMENTDQALWSTG